MPFDRKIDEQAKRYIRANWYKLTAVELAKELRVVVPTIVRHAKKMGLPPKQRLIELKKVDPAGGCTSFVDMVETLIREAEFTLTELDEQLEECNAIDGDSIAIEATMKKTEKSLLELEMLRSELMKLTPNTSEDAPLETFEELVEYLDQKEVRKREGRRMELLRISAQAVQDEWGQLCEFENGEVNQIFLRPEGGDDE